MPSKPFQQLLSVLPPKSSKLLPKPFGKLLINEKSIIKKFCPDVLDIDLDGKRREWEGIVLLPFLDHNIVRNEYYKILEQCEMELTEKDYIKFKKELNRNIVGNTLVYKRDLNKKKTFYSFYGDIKTMINIKVIEL